MKSTPLLMKGPLVLRTLSGEKTETRRIVNDLLEFGQVYNLQESDTPGYDSTFRDRHLRWHDLTRKCFESLCPYGQPGDRLWVRETWRPDLVGMVSGYNFAADNLFTPHADTEEAASLWAHRGAQRGGLDSWRPSIFMPRDICRLELEIVSVRCERLQEITPDAVRAEGVGRLELGDLVAMGASWGRVQRTVRDMTLSRITYPESRLLTACDGDLLLAWRVLWSVINDHRPGCRWDDNPWVWVLGYRRAQQ